MSLGLLLDLDLERAKLVVPSNAVVLCPKGGGGLVVLKHVLLALGGRSSSKTQGLGLEFGLRLEFGPGAGPSVASVVVGSG